MGAGIRARLTAALREAIRTRDAVAASVLRSALAEVSNAEAVPAHNHDAAHRASSPHFAGAAAGLGAAEVARRDLAEADVAAIVRAEVAERLATAAAFDNAGHATRASRLRREAEILTAVTGLDDLDPD